MADYSSVDEIFEGIEDPEITGEENTNLDESIDNQTTTDQEPEPQPQVTPSEGSGRNVRKRSLVDLLPQAIKPNQFQEGYDAATGLINGEIPGIPGFEESAVNVRDWVDNTFQGDQRSKEEIAEQRRDDYTAFHQNSQEVQQAGRKVIADVYQNTPSLEPFRIWMGALQSARSKTLSGIEWIGDVVRYSNQNVLGYQLYNVAEKDNPFSDKYEWALWDLGQDELGAQSGFGQIVQGFVEFAHILKASGGLRGIQGKAAASRGVGTSQFAQPTSKVLQRYWRGASTANKLKLTTSAGLTGGLAGAPADFYYTLFDEDQSNLSSLIKDHAPDWYPTFLTALATDEDDNPYEAAFKSTLEGFPLGFGADAAGAWIVGARKFRKGIKEGKSPEVAGQEAVKAVEEKINSASPNAPAITKEVSTENLDRLASAYRGEASYDSVSDILETIQSWEPFDQVQWFKEGRKSGEFAGYKDPARSALSIEAQLIDTGGAGYREIDLPNGSRISFEFRWNDFSKVNPDIYRNPIEVSWEVQDSAFEKAIGPHGKKLITDFQKIAQKELTPGTLLVNYPSADSGFESAAKKARTLKRKEKIVSDLGDDLQDLYVNEFLSMEVFVDSTRQRAVDKALTSWAEKTTIQKFQYAEKFHDQGYFGDYKWSEEPNVRSKIYKRAGFSEIDPDSGAQYAMVRQAPDNSGKWIEPVDINQNDVDKFTQIARNTDNIAEGGSVISKSNNSERLARWRVVRDQQRKGIPVTWDDIKAIFPEYFQPGTRVVTAGFHENVLGSLAQVLDGSIEGFSLNPFTGELPPNGWMVAIDGATIDKLDEDSLLAFITKHSNTLAREDVYIGGWLDPVTNKPVLELSRLIPDNVVPEGIDKRSYSSRQEAAALGFLFDQKTIFNNKTFQELNTYGDDLLKDTKGQHTGTTPPMDRRVVDATTATAQMLKGDTESIRGARSGTQRTLTNAQIRLLSDGTDEGVEGLLRSLNATTPIKLDELAEVARKTDAQIKEQGIKLAQDALGLNGEIDYKKISWKDPEGGLLSAEGIIQVRRLLQELSQSLWESSYQIVKLGEANMDAFPQIKQLAESYKALSKIHKVSANQYGRFLHTYSIKIPYTGKEITNPLQPPSIEKLAQEIRNGDKVLDDLVKKVASGDPAGQREALRLANALLLADGNPSLTKALWKHVGDITIGQGLKIMYDSLLSGPATHFVNIASNAVNTIYRPVAAFTGGDIKSKKMAIAGFYNLNTTLMESFNMASRVIKNNGMAINDGNRMALNTREIDARMQIIENIAKETDETSIKAASGFLHMQKDIANFPLFSWPTKFLVTGDEFFKTMVSRMEYNSRIMEEAIEQAGVNGTNLEDVWESLYKSNIEKNFDSKTGAILNDDLLNVAKETTFQTELEGAMKHTADFLNQVPILKPFFPFIKTGHNIMVYSASHVPILNQFLTEVRAIQNGDDEYAKAVLRGRQAYGSIMILSAAIGAHTGAITGNAPADPEARRIWLQTNQERSIKVGTYIDKNGNKKLDGYVMIVLNH